MRASREKKSRAIAREIAAKRADFDRIRQ